MCMEHDWDHALYAVFDPVTLMLHHEHFSTGSLNCEAYGGESTFGG